MLDDYGDDFDIDRAKQRKSRRRHRGRRKHHRNTARNPDKERCTRRRLDERELTIEERAERRVRLIGDLVKYGLIATLLLYFIPLVGFILLMYWGFKLGRRFYRQFIEPELRERFIEQEVEKQVEVTLSRERKTLRGEQARSLEQLSASIAHEIRNPITAAKSLVQQMEEEPTSPENLEYARVALEELHRVERSVSHLLRFARDEEMRATTIHLVDVLDSALETFRDRVARSGIELRRNFDCEGEIVGDSEQLRRVFINLVGNAIDALEAAAVENARIDVETGENLAGTEVWVRVADNGPGIDALALERIWSPFYTSKAAGTGLGLAICRKLVEAHGGRIDAESRTGAGAAFILIFPRRGHPSRPDAQETPDERSSS